MADEIKGATEGTTGQGTASSAAPANTPQTPAPTPTLTPASTPAPAPAPLPTPSSPPTTSMPTPAQPVTPVTAVPPPPALEIPSTPTEAPKAPPTTESLADMAQILEEVKLPARRDMPGAKQIENKAASIDTALGATVSPENTSPPKEAATTPAPQKPAPQNPSGVVTVHTLKDDLQHVVYDQKVSLVKAVSLEEDRKHKLPEPVDPVAKKSNALAILFTVFLLLLLGGAALVGAWYLTTAKSSTSKSFSNSLMFAESSVALSLDNRSSNELRQMLASAREGSQGAVGSIQRIVPVVGAGENARPATLSEFMQAIGARPPEELLRAVSSDFFLGLHTVDEQAPILVVPVASYDHAFAGMLAWEKNLNGDLAPMFTALSPFTRDAQGLPMVRAFKDVVQQNYDTRVLFDDAGQIQLYYSLPTRRVLIIAESPYSFSEVLSRLQAARAL